MAVPVETAPVQVGPIQRRLTAVGSLRSNELVILRPEVAGRIADIRFNEGEQVTKGQALVVLDNSIYRAELEEAQASIELSQANYDRAIDLLKRERRHHQGARRGVGRSCGGTRRRSSWPRRGSTRP